jgi:cytochrome c553
MKAHFSNTGLFLAATILSLTISTPAVEVKELWEKNCASCHGKDGRGETKMGKKAGVKDYTDPKVQEAMKDDDAIKAIKEGKKDKGKEVMKPFAEKLSDDEVKALAAYVRTFKKQ